MREFALAHAAAVTGVGAGVILFGRMATVAYEMGKAARQAAVSFNELREAFSKGGGGFKSLFPEGSILGGNKRPEQEIKKAVNETKKLVVETEKVKKQYRETATGINKLREQLSKTKKIQDQLLSSSKGYENVSKKVLNIQREITKQEDRLER